MAGRALELGGKALPSGAMIVMPVLAVHRYCKLWADPGRFDPDRLGPEAEAKPFPTQFMPFGFGPRTSIGMAFAMIEATVILATLVREAGFACDGRHVPEPVSRVTLQPRGGMPLRVTMIDRSARAS